MVEHTEDGKPTRRTFMAGGAAAIGLGAAAAGARPTRASAAQQRLIDKALASATSNAQLSDVKHVVILMQENRSFDHYFGTLSGVRGFSDPGVLQQTVGGVSYPVFDQFGYQPGMGVDASGYMQPFNLVNDPPSENGETTNDIAHDWGTQHNSWNNGAMNAFMTAHLASDGDTNGVGRTGYAALMAKLDEKHQTNHVTGVCACVADSRHQDPSAWPGGFLLSFAKTLQDEQESQRISDRYREARALLAEQARWLGGRTGYGTIAMPMPGGGYTRAPDTDGTAPIAAEAARRVIAGQTVTFVIADLNARRIPAADGGLWKANTLTKILRNPRLADLGIISDEEFRQLQVALDARAKKHNCVAKGRNYLDLIHCARCSAKVYKWNRPQYPQFFGRCRNELKRYEADCTCRLPMVPYDVIDEAITCDIARMRGDYLIETRLTNAVREQRDRDINDELIRLTSKLAAKTISRDAYLARQADLMGEVKALEADGAVGMWTPTGETAAERWARLNDEDSAETYEELRLWLVRLGVTYKLECVCAPARKPGDRKHWNAGEWTVTPCWPDADDARVLDRLVPPLVEPVKPSARP